MLGGLSLLGYLSHFSSVPTDQAVVNGKEALSGVIWVILLYVWQRILCKDKPVYFKLTLLLWTKGNKFMCKFQQHVSFSGFFSSFINMTFDFL